MFPQFFIFFIYALRYEEKIAGIQAISYSSGCQGNSKKGRNQKDIHRNMMLMKRKVIKDG